MTVNTVACYQIEHGHKLAKVEALPLHPPGADLNTTRNDVSTTTGVSVWNSYARNPFPASPEVRVSSVIRIDCRI